MALSLLHRYYVSSSSSSRPSLVIKSKFLSTMSVLFSAPSRTSNTNTPLLEVKDLRAVIAESNQEILKGVNLEIHAGEVHKIVGADGSGKSTLLKVLLGDPDYRVTGGNILFKGSNLLDLNPKERSSTRGFTSLTCTIDDSIGYAGFLNKAYCNALKRHLGIQDFGPIEIANMKAEGEKRNEMRQVAVLGGELGILDEIDSWVGGDEMVALITEMNNLLASKYPDLMTHYRRVMDFVRSGSSIHTMENGIISKRYLAPRSNYDVRVYRPSKVAEVYNGR